MGETAERHRLFDRIAVAVGVAAALMVIALAAFVLTHRDDLPTPGDDDLMARPAELQGPNGYDTLREASAIVEGLGEDEFRPRVQAMIVGEEWHPELLAELLRRNAPALEALERGVAAPGSLPEKSYSDVDASDGDRVSVLDLIRLFDLVGAETIGLSRRGERDAALERALFALRAGRTLAAFQNPSHIWLGFAAYCQGIGIDVLARLLRDTPLAAEEAKALAARIGEYRIPAAAWREPWATEYREAREALFPEDGRFRGDEHRLWLPSGYLYQRNRSIAVFAARVRERMRLTALTCRWGRDEASGLDPFPTRMQWIGLALAPNPVGRVNLELATTLLSPPNPLRCQNESKLGLAQLAVALRAWTQAEGALPDTLDALVPAYLDAIPLDGFGGAPLRYSKAKAVVYSIGKDLVDSGGASATDPSDSDEPAISVAF